MSPFPGPGARVLVIAKAPSPGRSKTRLIGPLTPVQAAELQRAMLLDVIDGCAAALPGVGAPPNAGPPYGPRPEIGVVCAGEADEQALRAMLGDDAWVVRQQARGLSDALRCGLDAGLAVGDAVALVSSDVPGVPAGALTRAFAALAEGVDVVLGPGEDGGYWLIALAARHDDLFEEIPWSTEAVLETTLARCAQLGLRAELVHRWADIDTPADLERARARVATLPGRRTAALLLRTARTG